MAETCETDLLSAFIEDAETSANGPLPVLIYDPERDMYFDAVLIGKKGQTFQIAAVRGCAPGEA